MMVLACYDLKGGVGKTTTAVNLAFHAAGHGSKTLVWDLDPQDAASYMFHVRAKVNGGGKALLKGKVTPDGAIKATDFGNLDLLPADFSRRKFDTHLNNRKRPALYRAPLACCSQPRRSSMLMKGCGR